MFMPDDLGARIWISGRVQGVGYRAFAVRAAGSLDLKGYCKNLADGRVEIVVRGERNQIEQLVRSLRQGPPLACVSDLKLDWLDVGEKFKDFLIRY